ncbi:hypothetical protein GGS23DRAFT_606989 [Durotheca rogersii]|uniref:uncharacterized protein n=1 Tax=Durotheca rogersii TaxID=419775 RepID=UPI00221FAA06|nr:uncharacterized protein GGS23DRAFT_606989 [Durotheca rogersii]KAI5860239.1 hypothetical protein GGS23DRAFT_606989 [Durotheca rogersii]
MGAPFPSIQSFYSGEVPATPPRASPGSHGSRRAGDGFTSAEIEEALNPLSGSWKPSRYYETCPLALLQTGPHNYQLSGRVVNFSTDVRHRGFHSLVVADGSGAIVVKLYYTNPSEYRLLLGQRTTVWATYIVDSTAAGTGSIPFCATATSIYPGWHGTTHIILHDDGPGTDGDRILRYPLEYDVGEYDYLPDLMTLKTFLASGHDMGVAKILVCVRSIGPRRTVQSKKRQATFEMVEVGIFDETATCVLKLWEDKVTSSKSWVPNQTILLLSKPTCRVTADYGSRGGSSYEIGIGYNSIVDVDPQFPDADWLRGKVEALTKRESVYTPFPPDVWDIELAIHGPSRILFTIADVEDQVRHAEPVTDFTGKLNVIILEVNLMEHWRRGTTCCLECCGVPIYANKPVSTCRNCGSQRNLALNPRILGSVIDESGMIAAGKLVWHDDAWTQLFFGNTTSEASVEDGFDADLIEQSWEDLTALDTNSLRDVEEQLLYSRVMLTFGWSSELERLCVLGVEW